MSILEEKNSLLSIY